MRTLFCFIPDKPSLSPGAIGALRKISSYSIADIRARAAQRQSVLDIPVFEADWPDSIPMLHTVLDGIASGVLPLQVTLAQRYDENPEWDEEAVLSVEEARDAIQEFRSRQSEHS